MNARLRDSMNKYYDERAGEFDEIYTMGKPPGGAQEPEKYMEEARCLATLVRNHCNGRILDIPCGTGYWLRFYAESSASITLVDQSTKMLEKCKETTQECNSLAKAEFINGDALNLELQAQTFDTILVGFFLSHVTDPQMDRFIRRIKKSLKPSGSLLVLDSIWSRFRKSRPKEGNTVRELNDGRRFDIYKRYFEESDVDRMAGRFEMDFRLLYTGQIYMGFSGTVPD